ncbi:MAG: hypothetical protein R6U58_10755 [Bacteroidales bacterium]
MTKKNILKLAMTVVATLIFGGAMAQTNGGAGVPGSADVTFDTGGTDGGVFYMIEGTTIPLYAEPDAVYHSDWTYDSDWSLTDGFIWNWSVSAGDAGNVTFTPAASNTRDNYVELNITTTGTYQISVTEEAPAAYGGCEGAAQTLDVEVVDAPSVTLGALDGTSDNFCITDGGIPTEIIATISDGWRNYRVAWTLEIATLGAGLVEDEWFDTDLTTSLGGAQAFAEDYTEAAPNEIASAGDADIMTVASFSVINNKPTVYTYTLTSINDQALRFGDYIGFGGDYGTPAAADFTYNAVGESYSVQINPAPATGPIYHIPEDFAL